MVQVIRQADVIPARVAHAARVPRLEAVDRPREVGPRELIHVDRLRDVGPCPAVYLRDEDGIRHVVRADVAPGDVLRKTLAARPALEPRSVQARCYGDIVEQDVAHVGKAVWIRAQGADAHAVREVADRVVAKDEVVRIGPYGNGVVAIVYDAVLDQNVGRANAKAVCVERE